jgi:hypothetical protein
MTLNYLDYRQINNDPNELLEYIEENPDFHVVLDNDCFVIYPRNAHMEEFDDYSIDAWSECGQSIDMNPDQFLMLLIEYIGGTVERC